MLRAKKNWNLFPSIILKLKYWLHSCLPTEIEVPEDVLITNVKCGGDGTIFITDQGAMLACGRNTRNKLALSDPGGLFSVRSKVF